MCVCFLSSVIDMTVIITAVSAQPCCSTASSDKFLHFLLRLLTAVTSRFPLRTSLSLSESGCANATSTKLDMRTPSRLLCFVYCSCCSPLQDRRAQIRNEAPLHHSLLPLCRGCTSCLECSTSLKRMVLGVCFCFCVFEHLPLSYPRSSKKELGDKFVFSLTSWWENSWYFY